MRDTIDIAITTDIIDITSTTDIAVSSKLCTDNLTNSSQYFSNRLKK